jgi:short-subunit dehydrogenase
MKLKRLSEQVVVITGASSGIGLVTARKMAAAGARLVLAARSSNALSQLVEEIAAQGGQAVSVVADVGKQEDVQRITRTAIRHFGAFDTWVNNAGVSIFGRIEDTPIEDMRKLFETDYWGVVYGSLEAVSHLRGQGGALINIGSVVSERAVIMQGVYSAAKFAVKGFTDALRMELEHAQAPISVTLIQPTSIDTPFAMNARNLTGREFRLPAPVYSPDLVAGAIMHAAENPRRDLIVGGGGKGFVSSEHVAPRLADQVMQSDAFVGMQLKDQPASPEQNALHQPSERLAERGNYDGHVMRHSLYTTAVLHPVAASMAFFTVGLGLAALVRRSVLSPQQQLRFTPAEQRELASSI